MHTRTYKIKCHFQERKMIAFPEFLCDTPVMVEIAELTAVPRKTHKIFMQELKSSFALETKRQSTCLNKRFMELYMKN